MNVPQSLVLGLIQGLTEFIPVSSTAHLILAPEVLPIPRASHTYDTIIQLGTVFPVLIYFWRDWLKLLQAAGRVVKQKLAAKDAEERLVKYIVLGSIPAGVAGLALNSLIERISDPAKFPPAYLIIGASLIFVGLLLWWTENTSRKARTIEQIKMPDAWLVGIAQAFALVPGVSRSGATITAGLFTGLTREAAARFSFLLMTPVMLAATGYKVFKLFYGHDRPTVLPGEWGGMVLATVVAAITGYLSIAFLLNWLRTRSFGVFALWRILVGGFSIALYFIQRGH